MHDPLENRTYHEKKLLSNFLGANFLAPKRGHRLEKHPVLGLETICLGADQQFFLNVFVFVILWPFVKE